MLVLGKGEPTLSVSCSDKLAKWCHLGIQGSLLMTFLEKPIYLTSFVILKTTPFCPEAFDRAISRRLENVQLIEPYFKNGLHVYTAALEFEYKKKSDKLPCSSSIAWFQNHNIKLVLHNLF